MQKVNNQWGIDLAHRIGMGGTVERVHTAEGATLHIRCSGGRSNSPHIVDVKIRPNLDPNGTAKQMLNRGWTLGRRKIICPDCGKRTKPAKAAKRRERQATVAEMPLPVIPPEVTPAQVEKPIATDRCAKARASVTPEQRREWARKGGLARQANRLKREEERLKHEGRIPAAPCPTLKETTPMATQPAAPAASDPARAAKRAVMQWLDEAFNPEKGTYAPGVTDATIAKETGMAEAKVKALREEFYGPLGEPDELRELKERMAAAKDTFERSRVAFATEIQSVERKFAALCSRMGWPVA